MFATTEGTRRFADRQPASRQPHFRLANSSLWLPSLGLGTYLGEADAETDAAYEAAFSAALAHGVNVFDCAINYRFQRSERALGRWLARALASGALARDEIVIATKGGYVPYDGCLPEEPSIYVKRHYLETDLAKTHEFAARLTHCMAPAYLEYMISLSLRNLGVACIDIYYLHNPETQSIALSAETFRIRMLDALETLENAVGNGQIASYGLATWTALRVLPDAPDYLSLTELVGMASEVAGQNHHLRYVQLPYNLFMTEAYAFENQQIGETFTSAIETAAELGLTVMISSPLMQGRLASIPVQKLAAHLPNLSPAQQALQFVRSTEFVSTALVGMKHPDHLAENLALTDLSPLDSRVVRGMYTSK